MVVVERAQAFVHPHLESKPLRDPLDGKVAKLLKFLLRNSTQARSDYLLIHNNSFNSLS